MFVISSNSTSLTSKGVSALNRLDRYYASATKDFNYKGLIRLVEGAPGLIGRCLLKLQFPDKNLSVREVQMEDEFPDSGVNNFWAAFHSLMNGIKSSFSSLDRNNEKRLEQLRLLSEKVTDGELRGDLGKLIEEGEGDSERFEKLGELIENLTKMSPQNLRVDAAFTVEIDDEPAIIVAEMQVGSENMAIRLLSYVCKFFAQSGININNGIIPNSVYGFAFCFKGSCGGSDTESRHLVRGDSLDTKNVDILDTYACQAQHSQISIHNVYLGTQEAYRAGEMRKNQLRKRQYYWKKKVLDWFNGDGFRARERFNHSDQEANYSDQEANYSDQKANYSDQEANYSDQKANYSDQKANYSDQKANYSDQKANYSDQKANYSDQKAISNAFDKAPDEVKKVYSLIEMIALSTLMTPDDVREALSYLSDTDKDKEIFNQMYERLRIKEEDMNPTDFNKEYSDLLQFLKDDVATENNKLKEKMAAIGQEQEDVAKENSELKKEMVVAEAAGRVLGTLDQSKRNKISHRHIDKIIEDIERKFPGIKLSRNRVVEQVKEWRSDLVDGPKGGLRVSQEIG